MFILTSAILGTLIGHFYGLAFLREKRPVRADSNKSALTRKLSVVAIVRYLVLAGCLAVLFSRNLVHPISVLGGVLVGFWLVVIKQTRKRHENRII